MKSAIASFILLSLVAVFTLVGCSKNDDKYAQIEQEIFVKRVSPFSTQTSINSYKMDSDIWGFKLELEKPITRDDGKVITEIIATNMVLGGGRLFYAAVHPDRVYRMKIMDLYTTEDGKHYQTSNPIVIQ